MTLPQEKELLVPKRLTAGDVILPSAYRGNTHIYDILNGLFQKGYAVVDAKEGEARSKALRVFDRHIETLFEKDQAAERFLVDSHPTYGVNWLGYVRYLIGEAVQGRKELPFRNQPRGVGDRSGRR